MALPENSDHLRIAQEADLLASDFAGDLEEWELLLHLHLGLLLVLLPLRGQQGPENQADRDDAKDRRSGHLLHFHDSFLV